MGIEIRGALSGIRDPLTTDCQARNTTLILRNSVPSLLQSRSVEVVISTAESGLIGFMASYVLSARILINSLNTATIAEPLVYGLNP
jgi:hypothetical protein